MVAPMSLLRRRSLPILLVLAVTVTAGLIVWQLSWRAALAQVAARAETDLTQTSERLIAQLQGDRELAVMLADHPEVESLLGGFYPVLDDPAQEHVRQRAETLLEAMADMTGALRIAVYRADGGAAAVSDRARGGRLPDLWAGAMERALQGALGRFVGVDAQTGRRSFGFVAPIFNPFFAAPAGALVVAADLEGIEAEWRADPAAVFFRDASGRVLISNRSELVLTDPDRPGTGFPAYRVVAGRGGDLWRLPDGGPYLPELALHLARDLPQIGMTAEVLVDVAPAERLALSQTGLAGLAALSLGGFGLWLMARRAAMQRRLASEAAAKEVLERRVAERTRALSQANQQLRREVAERHDAEAQLRAAQARLVQAGKLSALGEMSAGISHELNQPLMAIRSFAENGRLLLEQGRSDVVAQNLARIAELGDRMARIIRNLRAFARAENAPVRPIDPVQVIGATLEMVESRLRQARVALDWHPPDQPVRVMAGEVRLQQVVTNLVTNALDAMAPEGGSLTIRVVPAEAEVQIVVADRGPGLVHPDRIFDPFYTTKEVGPGEGMGLGLSISYGLVQSFGGAIEGVNRERGGAVFTVTLPRAAVEVAA